MTKADINSRLVTLYQEIGDYTQVPCSGQGATPCRVPHSCCDPSVCELMIEQAKWDWDVELPRTEHPKYPLMATDGHCTAPPHMRPLCAVHCCVIQAFGGNLKDPAWTKRYWGLRNKIERLEWKKKERVSGKII